MKIFWDKTIVPLLNVYTVSALILFFISTCLLLTHFLTGGEFVSFIVVIGMFSIVIKMLPEIIEFSIAGNSVKLRERLSEAKEITLELRALSHQMKVQILDLIMRAPGDFGGLDCDSRYPDFIRFYEYLYTDTDIEKLKPALLDAATALKNDFIDELKRYIPEIGTSSSDDIATIISTHINSHEQSPNNGTIQRNADCVKQLTKIINELN